MKNTSWILGTLLSLSFVCTYSTSLFAASVAKVKGRNVLVNLEGDPAQAGDIYYTLTAEGKRAGIIKLKKIKGDRAIAILGKGRALPGFGLEYRAPKGSQVTESPAPEAVGGDDIAVSAPTPAKVSPNKMYWGGIVGFAMNKMDVDLKNDDDSTRATTSLSGNSFSAKGLFDYAILPNVWFRGTAGLEGFKGSGDSVCGTDLPFNQTCDVDINYLALDMWGRYLFSLSEIRPWLGAGFSLLFPLTKKASALDEGSISSSSVMSVGTGVDWFITPDMYIPVSIEFGLLPESEEVSASLIALRAGIAIPF